MKYAYRARISCTVEQAETIRAECQSALDASSAESGSSFDKYVSICDPVVSDGETDPIVCIYSAYTTSEARTAMKDSINTIALTHSLFVESSGHNCYNEELMPCSDWELL